MKILCLPQTSFSNIFMQFAKFFMHALINTRVQFFVFVKICSFHRFFIVTLEKFHMEHKSIIRWRKLGYLNNVSPSSAQNTSKDWKIREFIVLKNILGYSLEIWKDASNDRCVGPRIPSDFKRKNFLWHSVFCINLLIVIWYFAIRSFQVQMLSHAIIFIDWIGFCLFHAKGTKKCRAKLTINRKLNVCVTCVWWRVVFSISLFYYFTFNISSGECFRSRYLFLLHWMVVAEFYSFLTIRLK